MIFFIRLQSFISCNKPKYGTRDFQTKYRNNLKKAEKGWDKEGGRNVTKRQQAHRRALVGMKTKKAWIQDRRGNIAKPEYKCTE